MAAIAGYYLFGRWNGDGADRIAFSGNIELTEVKMSFKTAGRMVDLLVKEGDPVRRVWSSPAWIAISCRASATRNGPPWPRPNRNWRSCSPRSISSVRPTRAACR